MEKRGRFARMGKRKEPQKGKGIGYNKRPKDSSLRQWAGQSKKTGFPHSTRGGTVPGKLYFIAFLA